MNLFTHYFKKRMESAYGMLAMEYRQHHLQHSLSRFLPNNFLSAFYCIYKVSNSLPKTIKYRQLVLHQQTKPLIWRHRLQQL